MQGPEHRRQCLRCHFFATLDAVGTVHQHFRLDDRHDVGFLTQRCVTSERMRVRFDGKAGRNVLRDVDDCTPFCEARAELVVLRQAVAQTVETFCDRLAGEIRERLCARIDLDTRDDPEFGQILSEGHAIFGLLAKRFVVENHAADVVGGLRGSEQHFAISATCFFRRFQPDGVKALLDRAARFVGRQQPLPFRHHRPGGGLDLVAIHKLLHLSCVLHGRPRAAGRLRGARRITKSLPASVAMLSASDRPGRDPLHFVGLAQSNALGLK